MQGGLSPDTSPLALHYRCIFSKVNLIPSAKLFYSVTRLHDFRGASRAQADELLIVIAVLSEIPVFRVTIDFGTIFFFIMYDTTAKN